MPKFVFQYEAVLKQRRAAEREKQLVVAGLERDRRTIEDHIRGLQAGIEAGKHGLRERLAVGGGVDLRAARMEAGASLHLVARAQRAVVELAGVHRRIDAARLELIKAAVRRKAIETLRERRHEAWRDEQKRREAAALDELNVMRAATREADL